MKKSLIKNIEARALSFGVLMMLVVASLTTLFVILPSDNIVSATSLPLSWSGLYDTMTDAVDYQEGYIYKNATNDYYYFYVDRGDWELYYIRNTTADSDNAPIFDGSATTIGSEACYFFGVIKVSNVMYVYWAEQGVDNDINYASWTGSGFSSETDTGDNEANRGGTVLAYDDGTSDYWMTYNDEGADDVRIQNSTDGTTWGTYTKIYDDGTKPKLAVYDGDLYCFFYHDNGGSDGLQYKKFNATAGWTPSGDTNANDVPGCPDTYEYNYPQAIYHAGEDCLFLAYSNQSKTDEPAWYRILNDSGWSDEYLLYTVGGADATVPQGLHYFDDRLTANIQIIQSGDDRDLHFILSNFTGTPPSTASSFTVSGLDGSDRITFTGTAGSTVWSNATMPGGTLEINYNINASDNCTEIRINLTDISVAQGILATNISLTFDDNNASWTTNTVAYSGTNVTINESVWDAQSWCSGTNPFPIDGVGWNNGTMYCRFELEIDSGASTGTYTIDTFDLWGKTEYV